MLIIATLQTINCQSIILSCLSAQDHSKSFFNFSQVHHNCSPSSFSGFTFFQIFLQKVFEPSLNSNEFDQNTLTLLLIIQYFHLSSWAFQKLTEIIYLLVLMIVNALIWWNGFLKQIKDLIMDTLLEIWSTLSHLHLLFYSESSTIASTLSLSICTFNLNGLHFLLLVHQFIN